MKLLEINKKTYEIWHNMMSSTQRFAMLHMTTRALKIRVLLTAGVNLCSFLVVLIMHTSNTNSVIASSHSIIPDNRYEIKDCAVCG